jgi:hypothetical protein
MAVDISGISYFAPILAFLVVFAVIFSLLAKTKVLGESKGVQLFISFVVATIFVSAAGVTDFVLTITPWFGALVVSLMFLLLIIGFVGKDAAFMHKGIGIGFVVVMVIVFLVSGFVVFSESIAPYLPGSEGEGADPNVVNATQWLLSSRISGAIMLLVIGAIVSWVLVRSVK